MTVIVTDGDGRTDSDTLFVYVGEAGPTVELNGKTEPPTGEETPYVATAETTNADLKAVTWRVDTRTVAEASLNDTHDRDNRSLTFTTADRRRLEVIVRDSENRTDSDVLFVDPQGADWDTDDSRDTDGSPDGSPGEDSSSGALGPDRQPAAGSPDCINGVFLDGNAGCMGHISDASHTDQEEGCAKDFCGVQNPARETGRGDKLTNDDSYSDKVSPDLGSGYGSSDRPISEYQSSHNSGGGKNNDAGYISV